MLFLDSTTCGVCRGISVRIIAREGDEVAERVKRHRSDEEEVEVYLSVLLEKWLDARSERRRWSVFSLPQRKLHSIARFWLARCALAPTIFFSRFVHMVHGMRRCAVHIARHGQHAHCAQRASGYKFCCYAQYACRKYYSQRTRCLHIACHVHQLARAQQWHVPRNGKPVQEPRNMH